VSKTFRKIGIALAAYRPNEDYFFQQLFSIQNQTHQDWVCWISFDSPFSELKANPKFSVFFKDARFYWEENSQPLGHLKNFEKAIQSLLTLKVDAIACCDQDDVWFPEKLERSLRALNEVGSLGLVFTNMKLINQKGIVSEKTVWEVERRGVGHVNRFDLLVRNVIPGTGMLMDAELAWRFPKIPARSLFHDHWYPLVAACLGGALKPISEPLYAYRIHGENVVGVTPYSGLLALSSGGKPIQGVGPKCRAVWNRSQQLAQVAEENGLSVGVVARWAFLRRWDFGLLLALRGGFCLISDPALARACFARTLGKLLEFTNIAKS
jgi:hypothetical protein